MIVLFAWLLADFISGLVHWWEDRAIAGSSRFDFVNSVRADNERHHQMPGYFLRLTWWENISTTAPVAWALSLVLFLSGAGELLYLTFFFLGFGNLVHRWAHDHRRSRIVALLQFTGLLISSKHHDGHHFKNGELVSRDGARIRYCVMSSWLNPVLDRIKFFSLLEKIFGR